MPEIRTPCCKQSESGRGGGGDIARLAFQIPLYFSSNMSCPECLESEKRALSASAEFAKLVDVTQAPSVCQA